MEPPHKKVIFCCQRSARHMKESNGRAFRLVPLADGIGCGREIHADFLFLEILGCLGGERHHAALTRANDQLFDPFFEDVLRLFKGDGMGCAEHRLGQLLLSLLDLARKTDEDIVVDLSSFNRDKAEFGTVNFGFHRAHLPYGTLSGTATLPP
jgi:hypothetical protein